MIKITSYTNRIEQFLRSEKGQRFFNFAYSIGAAIVIWGALFKILHLPGGNALLCVGMGTEIAMFILTAFDRPDYSHQDLRPATDVNLEGNISNITPNIEIAQATYPQVEIQQPVMSAIESSKINDYAFKLTEASEQFERLSELTKATHGFLNAIEGISERMSELNRNLEGLNSIYEIQLKNVAAQLETINSVNDGLKDIRDMFDKSAREAVAYCEETEKMTRYMKQINSVYEKMITAMSVSIPDKVNPFNQTQDNA